MPLERKSFRKRDEWLNGRKGGIGASDAAAAAGLSPWKSAHELWLEKTGRKEPKDVSDSSAVIFGKNAEKWLRGLYLEEHPEYEMEYHEFDIIYQSERPWLMATLDGEITERGTGRRGVWECKTATLSNGIQWEAWKGKIPQYYYCQILHQFLATGWEFVNLTAKLKRLDGNSLLQGYEFERKDVNSDLEWLLEKETEFWAKVESDTEPERTLPTPPGWI